MEGDKYQVKITANGLSGGTKKTIRYQGDTELQTGEELTVTEFKDRFSYSAHTKSGAKLPLPIMLEAPLGEGAQLLWDAWRNQETCYIYFESAVLGSQRVHGQFKAVMSTMGAPVSGLVMGSFLLSQVGQLTYDVVT